jgi:hypothetical protein
MVYITIKYDNKLYTNEFTFEDSLNYISFLEEYNIWYECYTEQPLSYEI